MYSLRLLTSLGHHVIEVADGREGVDRFLGCADGVDLVLTDIKMPRLDGIEMATVLRAQGSTTPVIFMTGHPDIGDISSVDFVDLLHKPFDIELLLNLIDRVEEDSSR